MKFVKDISWCSEFDKTRNMHFRLFSTLFVVDLYIVSVSAIHSWKACYTGTAGLSQFPEFVALNFIDDQLMGYFDSNSNHFKSQFKWMEDNLDKDYDQQQTNSLLGHTATFKNNIKVAMDRFNQTQGVHTFQLMFGCELDTDGTKRGYMQYGYDGEDFLSLDMSTLTWTAANSQAFITKMKWDAEDNAKYWKHYLENECTDWLKKYVSYGKDTLEKKVSPQVSLLQKSSFSPVTCHATGFYPSEVKISWQKNRQDLDEDVDLGEQLPNEDGTFQRMSRLKIEHDEWKKNQYSCVVEHKSRTFRSILTEKEIRTDYGIIVGIIAAVLLLVIIGVTGYWVYQKKTSFKPVNASDDGSDSSANT